MKKAILAGATFALAVLATGLVAAPVQADEWSKTYQISGKANLQVTTGDGDVTITSADQKQINARITTQGYKIGPGGVQVVESQNGDNVSIELKFPHMNWFGWSRHSLHVDLVVPRALDTDIHTGDGNVTAKFLTGNLRFNTGDGNVTTDGLHGTIQMQSGDGNILGTDFDGSLDARTGDGNISARGRFDSLNVKSGDGNVDAEAASGSKVNSWSVASGDGHITLRVPSDLQADLDAKTGDGEITVDVPLTVSGSLSRSSVHGKLNGGGGQLSLRSGDGSIHIERI